MSDTIESCGLPGCVGETARCIQCGCRHPNMCSVAMNADKYVCSSCELKRAKVQACFGDLRAVLDCVDVIIVMQMYADAMVAADRERGARICDDALALWRAGSTHITFQSIATRIVRGDDSMPLCWKPREWEHAQFDRGNHAE